MRWSSIIVLVLVASSYGCTAAHAQPPPKPPPKPGAQATVSPAKAPFEQEAPFIVDYRIVDRDGKVLVGGQTALEPPRPVLVDRRIPGSPDMTTLSLQASNTPTRDLMVTLHYREQTGEGGKLSWSPRVAVKRGETAKASIAFANGESRSFTLTVR